MSQRILIIDSQELSTVQDCPWKYFLKFNKQFRKSGITPEPLERGSLGHIILETYYNCLKVNTPFETALEQAVNVGREAYIEMDLDVDICEWTIKSFYQYAHRWRYDGIKVIEVEQASMFPLYEDDELKVFYSTKIDLLAEFPLTGIGPVDHKFRGQKAEYHKLDNQFIGYAVATNSDVVYINEIGLQESPKYTPEIKFRRIPLSYDSGIKERWIKNTIWWAKQIDWFTQNETFPQCHNTAGRQGITKCAMCEYNIICSSSTQQEMNRKIIDMYHLVDKWDVTKELTRDESKEVTK